MSLKCSCKKRVSNVLGNVENVLNKQTFRFKHSVSDAEVRTDFD
jgi:hypothetical protein